MMSLVSSQSGRACLLFLLLCGLMVTVNCQNNGTNITACCGKTEEDDLESADIAAIILGVILLLLLVFAVLMCILIKKGYIGGGESDVSRVMPVAMGFSTTADKLRARTYAAFEKEREQKRRPRKSEKQPIIYMLDDIYHPPNSRPLPYDGTIPNGYPAATTEVRTPRKQRTLKTERKQQQQQPSIPKVKPKKSLDSGDRISHSSSRTVSVNGHLIFPDNGRINFTTYYETSEPYRI